jgi:hypothetical protein
MLKPVIKIGCFGALRLFKNHLQQAIYAIEFSNKINKCLEFHINVGDNDKNSSILNNLRSLFQNTENILVEHPWYPHYSFLNVVSKMDMGLQLSFTETFNIVAADFVANDIPIVVSKEIFWANFLYKANPTNSKEVLFKMKLAYYGKPFNLHKLNKQGLKAYNKRSIKSWQNYIQKTS